jgi:hypothetical protein
MAWMDSVINFVSEYWYIFIVAGIIILLYFYSKASLYTKSRIKKVFSGKTLFVLVVIIIWYIWYRMGSIESVNVANRWMPILLLLFLAGYNYIGVLRYETQQVLCYNFHGCYSKPPVLINGFLIFAIDSFNSGGISWDYAQRILVLREETTQLLDRGAISIARPKFCSIYELPDDVKSVIENDKYLKSGKKQVYYGWFNDLEEEDWKLSDLKKLAEEKNDPKHIYNMLKKELEVDNPKVSTLYWLYRNECKARGKQTEQYDATVESVEKHVEHTKRVKDAYVDQDRDRGYGRPPEGHEEY